MDYNQKRIARIYERVYSKPPNSKEREAELAKLSDEDNAALYDYSVGLLSGRIKKAEQCRKFHNLLLIVRLYMNNVGTDTRQSRTRNGENTITDCKAIYKRKARYEHHGNYGNSKNSINRNA